MPLFLEVFLLQDVRHNSSTSPGMESMRLEQQLTQDPLLQGRMCDGAHLPSWGSGGQQCLGGAKTQGEEMSKPRGL